MKHKNLAVELLKRLLKGKIKAVARRNLVQSRKFSEMLEQALVKYNNRAIETLMVIEELIDLAKELNKAGKRGEDTGLSDDEVAFYDALAESKSAREVMGDEILKLIARDLTHSLRNSMTVDWNLRKALGQNAGHGKRLLKNTGTRRTSSKGNQNCHGAGGAYVRQRGGILCFMKSMHRQRRMRKAIIDDVLAVWKPIMILRCSTAVSYTCKRRRNYCSISLL